MNRADRRKQARQEKKIKRPSYHGLSVERRREQLFQNGITLQDLDNAFHDGFEKGYSLGRDNTLKMCYAAVCLACQDETDFDRDKIITVLQCMDSKVAYALDNEELINKVLDDLGIELSFSEALESRVQEV